MVEFQIFLTNRCQQHCNYCPLEKGEDYISLKELQNKFDKILQDFPDEEKNIHLFGGDPLLVYDELLKPFFNNYNFPMEQVSFFIATNGIALTKEKYKFLHSRGVEFLLSIDGPEEIHNKNRANYKLIINNFKDYIRNDQIQGVQSTISSNTIDNFYEIYKYFIDFPARHIIFNINKLSKSYTLTQKQNFIENLNKIREDFTYYMDMPFLLKNKYTKGHFGSLFQEFNEFDNNIAFGSRTQIFNRVFLMSPLKEDTQATSYYNEDCEEGCPLKYLCHPEKEDSTYITRGMCISLILNFYNPRERYDR